MISSWVQRIFSKRPLQAKFMAAIFLTAVFILGVSILFFLLRDKALLQQNLERHMALSTDLAKSRALAALFSKNPETAQQMLDFSEDKECPITAAALYLDNGHLLASWKTEEGPIFWEPPRIFDAFPQDPIPMPRGGELRLVIREPDLPTAVLMLRMDLSKHMQQKKTLYAFSLFTFLTGTVLAFFLSLHLRRILLRPIFSLVQTVEEITEKKDYAIRAPVFEGDQIGVLISGFNNMIQEIQEREAALTHHKATLQREVMERTMALTAANTKLAHLNMALQEAEKRDRRLLRHSENLEHQVLDRTVALTQANTKLTRLNMELREAKKRADEASSAKSAFLASMSHELRTPLNGILGYAQLLHRDGNRLNTKDQERIQVIRQCGEHLLRMINDILDLSKIEAGKMDLIPQPFRLSSFVQSTAGMARTRAREKGLALEILLGDNLPVTVTGDEHRLRQVLLNLLGNAIKFTEKGEIKLHVRMEEKGLILFEVSDTGIGIMEKDLPFIFKPFSRVEHVGPKPEGTGLGLSISQYLVRMMGGMISVESRIGKGSRFWFSIPLPQAPDKPESERPSFPCDNIIAYRRTDHQSEPLEILVVDDGRENRTFLVDVFSPLGFIVEQADSGQRALALCRKKRPDIILMDLIMPGMDGFTCIEAIATLFSGTLPPIIAVSASATPDVIEKSMRLGCAAFISKPVRIQQLFEVLCTHLPMVWISGNPKPSSSLKKSFRVPAPARIMELNELVRLGDISAIQDWCSDKEQVREYPEFSKYVKELAGQFRIRELNQWLMHLETEKRASAEEES
ncbi:ATP-binding protein [Desulfobotulus sp.]|jgi:signal transduction histidine kinase/ActR/RegA family two-component response regulator|uniref:HAMP domain-containing hybrid sensor histidine kinase/response regulator n=1 Tax=Desulfobotulus sp. TaxID=1940337 RepID=UPI002A36A1B4|nr:ATP-binding protein [Desulfobotulus sp.]MDY0162804.1 ATP-binding protein [Desulfobotulus sp.]